MSSSKQLELFVIVLISVMMVDFTSLEIEEFLISIYKCNIQFSGNTTHFIHNIGKCQSHYLPFSHVEEGKDVDCNLGKN